MKRFILMCMCICAISTASACGSSKSAEISLPKSYTLTADISSDDFAGKAQFERLEGGWQISVSEPKTLAGMEISLTDADCKISFEEMEQTFSREELPANSPIFLTAQVLEKCAAGKISGKISGEDYDVAMKNDKPQSAEIGEMSVKFSKFAKK